MLGQSEKRIHGLSSSHCLFPVFIQHFITQREEFETARDSILVWLTEMDLQLTNIEHFSECDVQAKIKQLRVTSPALRGFVNQCRSRCGQRRPLILV